ncbi:MAG: cytochrome c [Schleiferiaceae bacterium]|nr:cytochrome c [Schleiferiaceae bacterium]
MRIGIIKGITSLGVAAVLLSACNNDKTTPGYTYMDDMYRSPSVETYSADAQMPNGMSVMTPVEGTVSRGHQPYMYENTNEGYEAARTGLQMPEKYASKEVAKEYKDIYNKMCSHCHGTKGDGNGTLAEREKFLGIPGYDKARLPDVTPGSMYHVIMHGRNMMGSHASQLTEDERWGIVSYVWYELRGEEVVASTSEETVEEASAEAATEEDNEELVTENNGH